MMIDRPYCSCVCCMQALKNGMLIREKNPDMEVTICYMDIRSYGKGYEEYYERAKSLGIRFLRGMPSDVLADRNGMIVQVEDSETSTTPHAPPDLVVLSVGDRTFGCDREARGDAGDPLRGYRLHQAPQRCA